MTLDTSFDFNSNAPRAVIVIGDVATIPLDYEITMNSLIESDVATINLSADLFDMAGLWNVWRKEKSYIPVEIWSGYFNTNLLYHSFNEAMDHYPSNDDVKRFLISDNNFKRLLKKRWFGIANIPSFRFGDVQSADVVTINCSEVLNMLDDFMFDKKYIEDEAKVSSVLNDLIKAVKGKTDNTKGHGFTLIIDPDLAKNSTKMNYQLGHKTKLNKDDGTTEEIDKGYTTRGKTYFQVIKEICEKLKIDFVQSETDSFTYVFKEPKTSDKLYTLDRAKHFSSCNIHGGKAGQNGMTTKIGIVCKSVQDDNTVVIGKFPKTLDMNSNATKKIKIIEVGKNLTQLHCEDRASAIAQNYSKYQITGNIVIPNAIVELKPDNLLKFIDTTPFSGYQESRRMSSLFGDINFRIVSIKEVFKDGVGLAQPSVEFELDITNNLNRIDTTTGEIKAYDLLSPSDGEKINKETKQDSTDFYEYDKLSANETLNAIKDNLK